MQHILDLVLATAQGVEPGCPGQQQIEQRPTWIQAHLSEPLEALEDFHLHRCQPELAGQVLD